ncbi:MAG TPA: DUF1634 domain-containing protein, partial [Myxococcota bacterium]|nr:DUF1634 domain-containing protein [Myxococcota bacterium]
MTARWSDRQVEQRIGALLRAGVALAAAIVALGAALYLARHGGELPAYHVFRGEPAPLRSVAGILTRALDFRGSGVIQLGLLVLLATPVARVALAAYAFAQQRDRLYLAVSLFVLAVLLYSIAGPERAPVATHRAAAASALPAPLAAGAGAAARFPRFAPSSRTVPRASALDAARAPPAPAAPEGVALRVGAGAPSRAAHRRRLAVSSGHDTAGRGPGPARRDGL